MGLGTCQNLDRDAHPFLGFEISLNPFFCVGKLFSYFLGSQNLCYFCGPDKFAAICLGLPVFVSHTSIL